VIADCRSAYETFEFHKVYHTLNQFCAVDLSSLYIDITKDRMFCDAPDSPRRRATQAAMHKVFDALCRLLAPILVFTAEEAWGYLISHPERNEAKRNAVEGSRESLKALPRDPSTPLRFAQDDRPFDSVHLQLFPETDEKLRDSLASEQVDGLLKLRAVIGQAIERARQEKLIGNGLEAAVVLHCDKRTIAGFSREELEEFFILSDLQLRSAEEPSASISKTAHLRCARCWRHRPAVGKSALHSELCDRCESVVTRTPPVASTKQGGE
jgi:isoleucyl-tRNA synthetase